MMDVMLWGDIISTILQMGKDRLVRHTYHEMFIRDEYMQYALFVPVCESVFRSGCATHRCSSFLDPSIMTRFTYVI